MAIHEVSRQKYYDNPDILCNNKIFMVCSQKEVGSQPTLASFCDVLLWQASLQDSGQPKGSGGSHP